MGGGVARENGPQVGKPLKLGAGGVSACKNPACVRNKPGSHRSLDQGFNSLSSGIARTNICGDQAAEQQGP